MESQSWTRLSNETTTTFLYKTSFRKPIIISGHTAENLISETTRGPDWSQSGPPMKTQLRVQSSEDHT